MGHRVRHMEAHMESVLYVCGVLALGLVLYIWRQRVKRWNDLYRIQRDAELDEQMRNCPDGLPEIELYRGRGADNVDGTALRKLLSGP